MVFYRVHTLDKMTNEHSKYDLDKRTFKLAKATKVYVDKQPGKTTNYEIGRQLIQSAGSVGANSIEADEALSRVE